MKSKLLIGLTLFFIWNTSHANNNELDIFKFKNSYLLYSFQDGKVYSWLKLAGDDSQGNATSGGCDLLFSGVKKNNTINGNTLSYETDISQNSLVKGVVAYKENSSILFNNDTIFNQCGLNIVYGDFIKIDKKSKYYSQGIKEIIEDNLFDVKNNKNSNSDAYANLINNLSCKNISQNIVYINDIGYFLEQKNYLKDASKILKKVVYCSPNRAVAFLNLGDTLSSQSKNEEAKFYYDEYKKIMIQRGLSQKIPKRILD